MVRMLLVSLVGLSLVGLGWADDTKPKADPKPQWQRMLTGDHVRKAAQLDRQIGELEKADKYAEAIQAAEELLALRSKVQGAGHWQTADEKWLLVTLKKVAALSEEKRVDWRKAARGADEAARLEQNARYPTALPLRKAMLKSCLEVLGEDHPETAASYNNLAANLNALAEYKEAEPLYQKALDISRKTLGEDHLRTSTCYNNLAANLAALAKHAEAARLFRKALDIRCRVLGEDDPETAASYHNLAAMLKAQTKYAEAEPLLQKALDIFRKTLGEDHPNTAHSYNSLAHNLNAQGRYVEAGPLYQKALDIWRKARGEDHPDTAIGYHNVAANLADQGKYAEAAPLAQKALDIWRKTWGEYHPLTAQGYSGVAINLSDQGKYVEAGELLQKMLDIRRRVSGEDHPDTARAYHSVAINLYRQNRYAESGRLFQKALDIWLKAGNEGDPFTAQLYTSVAGNLQAQKKYDQAGLLFQKALDHCRKTLGEEHPEMAQFYNSVGANLYVQEKYEKAGPLGDKALDICRKVLGEGNPHTALCYYHVAANLHRLGKYADALESIESATKSFEAARLGVAARGLDRAAYGASRSPHAFLAAARIQAGKATAAWAALEADLGRGLLDEIQVRRGLDLTPAEQRQRKALSTQRTELEAGVLALATRSARTDAEAAELKRLLDERRRLENSLGELATAVGRREVATLEQLQAALPADAAFVVWVDAGHDSRAVREHWGCVVRPSGEPRWERLPVSGPDKKWTEDDGDLPLQFRDALVKSAPAAEVEGLAKKLHAQRLAPLARHLVGVKRLFVASVNDMAGIPIEALTDRYTVSYTPSGTYLARLKDRERPRNSGLLAVGDPVFPRVKETAPPTALPPGGLLILQVVPGSAADRARLKAGDVLVAYAGEDLTSTDQLGKLIAANAGAKLVLVKFWREAQEKLADREVSPGRLGVLWAKEPAREYITARRQADQLLGSV